MSSLEKQLIIVDLDGTLLNRDYTTLNQQNKKVLSELQKQGHKVCIATGRNYLSALSFYREIGLNTFLITYNGAYVNHPLHKDIPPLKLERISNSTVREILAEKVIQENLLNVLFDSIHRETISTSDDIYYQEIFFNGNPYVKIEKEKAGEKTNIWEHLQGQDCLQLVLEFPFFQGAEAGKMDEIILALGKYHKKSIVFDLGKKMKAEKEGDKILVPDPTKLVFKIRNMHADKFEAVKLVASHYNISLSQVIAFGNDVNDIKMLSSVGKGVAVSNSDINLKIIASAITKSPSYEAGVAKYLVDYFKLRGQNEPE